MNWKEIKENYPKGWAKLQLSQSIGKYGEIKISQWMSLSSEGFGDITLRDFYDFFDEQGIYIELTLEKGGRFHVDILDKEAEYLFIIKEIFNTRTEAEEAAFNKAFEILENKL